ncbi:P-loop containing nucleoside triphosphate hydrolase protein [Schizophyllum commune]
MSAPQLDIGQLSDEEVRAQVKAAFQVDPCHWQVQAIRTLSQRADKISEDQCVISATGSGKTITFLAPLLFVPQGTLVIISPLNLLSEQIATQLQNMRIPAIAVTAGNATRNVFQAIRELKYRVVVTNIEIAGRPQGEFEKLWRDRKWSSKLICVVWDEAHCVCKWADFRPEYKDAGRIRRIVPDHIPFFLTSATLPKAVLLDVYRNLVLQASNVNVIHRSNDRPNIHLVVRRMQHALGSFRDLDFIIPTDGRPPPTFVIFFNDIRQSFRRAEMENLASGETWGLICTDSFGLGVDTYRVKGINMCTLYQRIGRAIRSGEGSATALILVEPEFFDEEREEKQARKRKKEESADSAVKGGDGAERGNKRRKTDDASVPTTVEVVIRGGPDSVVTARDSLLASRRVLYDTLAAPAPKKKGRAKAKSAVAIEPALDDMTNAQSRGFNCYRIPGQLYFRNDRIGTCGV